MLTAADLRTGGGVSSHGAGIDSMLSPPARGMIWSQAGERNAPRNRLPRRSQGCIREIKVWFYPRVPGVAEAVDEWRRRTSIPASS